MRFSPGRSPLSTVGSLAGLALALSACADPLAPTVGAEASVAPSFDVSAAATVQIGSSSATVWVCPAADAFSTSTANCEPAFDVARNVRWNQIDGVSWISNNPDGNQFYSTPQQFYYYKLLFNLPSNYADAELDIDIFADNAATLYLNSMSPFGAHANQSDWYPNYGCGFMTPSVVCGDPNDAANPIYQGLSNPNFVPPESFGTTSGFVAGTNVLTIRALNAVYLQSCVGAGADPTVCESATGLNFAGTIVYQLRGDEGCTPGYWKQEQHFDSWPAPYDPTDLISSVFDNAGPMASTSLLDALNGGGGAGVDGARKILLRAAVAAVLNAASGDVDYTQSVAEIVADVEAALLSGDRDTMLSLAAELDADNNLGCPLN